MTAEESLDTSKDKFPKDTIVSTNDTGAATDLDESKAKFIPNGDKDEPDHVIVKVGTSEFNGLTKEDLMKYANDPFWVRTRLILFVFFWVGWLAMLVAAIVIIVLAPRCPYKPDLKWYNTDVVYEITPRSFMDSDGDGNGDLKGVQEQFPYLASIGMKTLWIHSLFDSKFKDSGFGLINHTVINPTYGTEADIVAMVKQFKKDGRHLIADFIPFYTHVDHQWFENSRNKREKMDDYYIWADAKTFSSLPSEEKKMWYKDTVRNEYYLATMGESLPNLNLHNKEVRDELGDILRYWFARGVAGFHINDLEHAMTSNVTVSDKTKTQREQILEALYEWRAIADHYSDKPGRERLLFSTVTVTNLNDTLAYYGDETKKGLNFVAAANLETISKNDPSSIMDTVDTVLDGTSTDWRGWLLGDQDHSRIMSRMDNPKLLKALMTLQMLLPGTAFCYYGDEIGMKDTSLSNLTDSLNKADPNNPLINRYKYRSPMLWNTKRNAGFSTATPWLLPLAGLESVASQRAYNNRDPYPVLETFADLNQLRSNYSFQWGSFVPIVTNSKDTVAFVRQAEGFSGYLVAINFGNKPHTVMFNDHPTPGGPMLPDTVRVAFHSLLNDDDEFKPGVVLNIAKAPITLHQYEAAVFKFL